MDFSKLLLDLFKDLWLFFVGVLSGIENIFVVNMLRRVNKEVCRLVGFFVIWILFFFCYVIKMEELCFLDGRIYWLISMICFDLYYRVIMEFVI